MFLIKKEKLLQKKKKMLQAPSEAFLFTNFSFKLNQLFIFRLLYVTSDIKKNTIRPQKNSKNVHIISVEIFHHAFF